MRQLHFLHPLGSGAVGTVYLAELESTQGFRRQVAAKVLLGRSDDDDQFLQRMRDEARLLGLLRDEHVLKVLELVEVNGRDAVIMEYVEGTDLASITQAGHTVPARALAELGAAVAGALHRAHTAVDPSTNQPLNVIHRDVKPANVMVTLQGTVKLLDFGVARARFRAREAKTGQIVLGTLNYMAPEYIVTGDVTSAADLYGLGVVLLEAASGKEFGQPRIRRERFIEAVQSALEPLKTTHAALVPTLGALLAWNPEDRPTGEQAEQALQQAADDLTGASLRTWASQIVPSVRAQRVQKQEDRVGLSGLTVTLGETPARPTPPPPAPPVMMPMPVPAEPRPQPVEPPRSPPSAPHKTLVPPPPPRVEPIPPKPPSDPTSSGLRDVRSFKPRPTRAPTTENTLWSTPEIQRPAHVPEPPRPEPPAPVKTPVVPEESKSGGLGFVIKSLAIGMFLGFLVVAAFTWFLFFR